MGVVKKMGWYQCTVETLAGHSLCGIRQLPGISARRAGISFDGPHHSPFAWVLHFYAGPPFGAKGSMLLLCLPSALLILTFWLSSLTSGLPHLCGFTKKPLLCSSCFLWGWRYFYARCFVTLGSHLLETCDTASPVATWCDIQIVVNHIL